MKKRDIHTIIITFIMGAVVGGYLYVYGFMAQYGNVLDFTEGVGELVIVAREYGPCTASATCTSFRVAANGTYRLLVPSGEPSVAPDVYNGEIDSALASELREVFTPRTLTSLQKPLAVNGCAGFDETGANFQIDVTYSGTTYKLDTCNTGLAKDPAALQVFGTLRDAL